MIETKNHSFMFRPLFIAFDGWRMYNQDQLNTFVKAGYITQEEQQELLDYAFDAVPGSYSLKSVDTKKKKKKKTSKKLVTIR